MRKRFTPMDHLAMLRLSCRQYYWNISYAGKGSVTIKRLLNMFKAMADFDIINTLIYFVTYGVVVETIYGLIFIFKGIKAILGITPLSEAYAAVRPFNMILIGLLVSFVGCLIIFNPKRLKRSFNYKKSVFYRNTGITPKEVVKDKGLYGEYIATCAEEEVFKKYNLKGRIYNNVFIPHHGGNFSEADIVSVSNAGINVIEAKALGGEIEGFALANNWEQTMGKEVYEFTNPIFQNLNHMNYLSEYLAETVKNDDEIGDVDLNYLLYMRNTILFLDKNATIDIKAQAAPNLFYVCSGTDFYIKNYKDYPKALYNLLPREIVDYICEAIRDISFYTREEIEDMMADRQIAIDRGEYRYKPAYHIAYCEFVIDEDNVEGGICLIQEQNGYKFYFDPKDNWFKSMTDMRIKTIYQTYYSYQEAMNAYNSDSVKDKRYIIDIV